MTTILERQPCSQMIMEKEEVIGLISVLDETRNDRTIVVCQRITTHYQGHLQYLKTFYLDSTDGPQVYPTDDPLVFQLLDGTKLKGRGRCSL